MEYEEYLNLRQQMDIIHKAHCQSKSDIHYLADAIIAILSHVNDCETRIDYLEERLGIKQ